MKKTTMSIAVTTAILGASGVSFTAAADELITSDQSGLSTQSTQQASTVTKQDVDNAKSNLDKAQHTATEKNSDANTAQTNVETAQKETDIAKSNLDKAQAYNDTATPENIKEAEQNVKNAENNATTVTENQNIAKANVNDAVNNQNKTQADVNNAQNIVNEVDQKAIETGNALKDAEQAVKDAQSKLDDKEQAVDTVQSSIYETEQLVKDAEQKVVDAVNADKTTEQEKEQAKIVADNAALDRATKEKAEQEAQSQVNNQQEIVNDAVNATKKAKDDLINEAERRYPESVNLSQEWLDTFKQLINEKDPVKINDLRSKLESIANKDTTSINDAFAQGTNLSKENVYDYNNLDSKTLNALNQYFATLVNSIHKSLNDGKTVQANQNVIKFANDVAAQYAKKQNGWGSWHDLEALNIAAKENGLAQLPLNSYENLYYGVSYTELVSEYDLYESIYATVSLMFAGDSDSKYGHALGLINLENVGVSINSYKDSSNSTGIPFPVYVQEVHVINVPSVNYLRMPQGTTNDEFNAKFSELYGPSSAANLVAEESSTTRLQEAVEKAIANEKQANDKLNSLTSSLQAAKNELITATAAANKAQSEYDNLLNAPTESNEAQRELANYKLALQSSQIKLAVAKKELTKSINELNSKTEILNSTKANAANLNDFRTQSYSQLNSAKVELVNAVQLANTAQKELQNNTAKLTKAHEILSEASQKLNSLTHAGVNLDTAQTAYNIALANQNKAESDCNIALTAAKVASTALAQANKEYNRIYSQYLAQQTIDNDNVQTPPINNVTTKPMVNTHPSVNKGNNITEKMLVTYPKKDIKESKFTSNLPQTGTNDNSMFAIIGMFLVSIAALLLPSLRKKYQ